MSGWRPALRIARRSVVRARGRSALIAALVALPVAGAVMVDVVGRTLSAPGREADQQIGSADARVEVTAWPSLKGFAPQPYPGAWTGAGKPDRDPAGVDVRALLPAGTRVVDDPQQLGVRLRDGERSVRAELVIADAGEPLHRHAVELVSGRAPRGPDEVLISRALADRVHGARLTPADGPPVTVTGIARAPYALSTTAVFATPGSPLARAAAVAADPDSGPGPARSYLVDLPPDSAATGLWRDLARQGVAFTPRDAALHPERYIPLVHRGDASVDSLRAAALTLLVAGLGLLEVVLLAGTAFAVGARRQTRELGLVAAGGGTARHIRRIVLAQGLTLGSLGAAVGVAAGFALALGARPLWEHFADGAIRSWSFGPWEIACAALIGLLSGLAAAVVPAVAAGRLRPVDALADRIRVSRAATRRRPLLAAGLLVAGGVLALLGNRLLADDFSAYARVLARVRETGAAASPPSPTGPVGVIVLGSLLMLAGVVLLAPVLIDACARVGSRLPVSARLAVRDAARNRHRTGPATSAIAVAVAGSVVLAFMVAGTFRADQLRHVPEVPPRVLAVAQGDADIATARRAAKRAAAVLPASRVQELRWMQRPGGIHLEERALYPEFPATGCENGCSGGGPLAPAGDATQDALAAGVPLDAAARAALRRGEVVVFDPRLVTDGHIAVRTGPDAARPLRLAAYALRRPVAYSHLPSGVVPAGLARRHGWTAAPAQVLVTFGRGATPDQLDTATGVVEDMGAVPVLERAVTAPPDALLLAITAIAGFVTLVGVAISVALSAAEGRADLATLAAVGAPPSRRRALAAGQALLVAGVGCLLGLALGSYVAFAARATTGSPEFVVPWGNLLLTAFAVPLAAVLVAALATPSRLPLSRRIA